MSGTNITEITSVEQLSSVQSSLPTTHLLVLSFHTPWAAPCTQMRTVLETLAATYPSTAPLSFYSINAEDLPDISEKYNVTAVPFLVLVRDGKVLDTVSGSDGSKVRDAVEKVAGKGTAVSGAAVIPPLLEAKTNTTATAPTNGVTDKEVLFARLRNLVSAAPVMLFMKGTPSEPRCGFSRQMVGILREKGVKYGFFNILADDDVRQGLKEFADWPTYPQLWVGGELVGGLDIVKEEIANDPDFFKQYSINKEAAVSA